MEEQSVVRDGLFDQLLEKEELGRIDHRMNALLKSLHGGKGLERIAKEDHGGVAPLGHGHGLQGLERQILADVIRGEHFLENDHLVVDLAETYQEVAVSGGGVNLVTEFVEGTHGGFEPFRGGESQQGGLVGGADEIKFVRHGYFSLSVAAMGVRPVFPSRPFFIRSEFIVVVDSPRVFLMLSIPRITGPRLVQ